MYFIDNEYSLEALQANEKIQTDCIQCKKW